MPFDGRGLMLYLAGHAIPGVESGDEAHYERNVRHSDGSRAVLGVSLDGPDAVRATLDGGSLPAEMLPKVRRLFDLDADSRAIDAHLAADPALEPLVALSPGIRLPGALDLHEQVVRTMIGQQISVAAARTVLGRLSAELDGSGLFPTADQFATRGLEALRGPRSRIRAIHAVALALSRGLLDTDADRTPEELRAVLLALPGIGSWTAGYVAMRVLGAPDVLLSTDLVLLKGAAKLGLPSTPRGLEEYAHRWAPYRSYASLHLWRHARQS